jgi:GT2 family glycosyltransferase
MYENPIFSIIILSHNQSKKTIDCFKSMKANCKTNYEIIWVDNGSLEKEFKLIHSAAIQIGANAKVLRNKINLGWVSGVNSAIPMISPNSKYVRHLRN